MTSSSSPPPVRATSTPESPHQALYENVRDALLSLPLYFRTETVIQGISAVEIFTLSAALGATIENQVVATLNQMRQVWDPKGRYLQYSFVRQSQTFPDVLLRRSGEIAGEAAILMGIELKGWYLLAKEAEPSFRFAVTPQACAPQDLIVVVPWALINVISGSPTVFPPFIENARYAAEYRNYHWQHLREAKGNNAISLAANVNLYPRKSDAIADRPAADSGGNFGRFARTGLMDEYLAQAKQELLAGIRAEHWLSFFKLFQDQRGGEAINTEIEKLRRKLSSATTDADPKTAAALEVIAALERMLD
jgi:hypothetical protein